MHFTKALTDTEVGVLAALWHWNGLQRKELCRRLELSRPTVERALRGLAELGLVHSVSASVPGRGRPARVFQVAPDAWTTLGMDFELPEVTLVLCNAAGQTVHTGTLELQENLDQPRLVLHQLAQDVRTWLEQLGLAIDQVQGLGIGLPGFLTPQGVSFVGRNLPHWELVPVRELLAEHLSIPVLIRHDVQLMALAEVEQRGWHDAVTLFAAVRPGLRGELRIGAAVCLPGRIYAGGHGNGGALYRAVVQPVPADGTSHEDRIAKIADRLVASLIHAIPLIDPDHTVLHAECLDHEEPTLLRMCRDKLQEQLRGEYIGFAEIASAITRGVSGAERAALAVTRQLLLNRPDQPPGSEGVKRHQDLLTQVRGFGERGRR